MENKTKNKKWLKLILWTLAIILITIIIFSNAIFGENTQLSGFFLNGDGFRTIATFFKIQVPLLLKLAFYIVITLVLSKIIGIVVNKILIVSKRGKTEQILLASFLKYLTAFAIIILILLVFGVNPTALFASVGVLGLVIGLGAQSLISDIISGLFIVFEDEFEVGDYIVIDDFRGKVESIGIRTIKFVDDGGNIKIINNSEIRTVVNLSTAPSSAMVEIAVSYEDYEKAEKVLEENIQSIADKLPEYLTGPDYIGPSETNKESIVLKFFGTVDEDYRFQAERDLRRELRKLFNTHQILNPYPRIVYTKDKKENKKENKINIDI